MKPLAGALDTHASHLAVVAAGYNIVGLRHKAVCVVSRLPSMRGARLFDPAEQATFAMYVETRRPKSGSVFLAMAV